MSDLSIEVQAPGMLTSIQDPGRRGVAFYGLPRSGWLDPDAAQLANSVVGNSPDAALLECNLLPPRLRLDGPCIVAFTGAAMDWALDGIPRRRNRAHAIGAGAVLSGRPAVNGARAYIAFAGQLLCQRVHGSVATDLTTGIGGLEGRRLRAGDVLHLSPATTGAPASINQPPEDYDRIDTIGLIPGPEWALLSDPGRTCLAGGAALALAADSNRMAARLDGPTVKLGVVPDMPSVPVFPGVVQLPPSGRPVVILRDGQTTGGYPRVAIVPESELGRFVQLRPGQPFRFIMTA